MLQIVLFPTSATLFLKYFAADRELCDSETLNISSCNRLVFVAFGLKNENGSAKVLWLQSTFKQKYFLLCIISFTFLPWIGKSCRPRS